MRIARECKKGEERRGGKREIGGKGKGREGEENVLLI